MAGPVTSPALLAVAGAMAALLTAGVAAGLHLICQPRIPAENWSLRLRRLAAECPWNRLDVAWLLIGLAAGRLAREFLPDGWVWDLACFQGVLVGVLAWRVQQKTRPLGAALAWRAAISSAVVRWLAIVPILWFAAFAWQMLLRGAGYSPDMQSAIRLFIETPSPWAKAGFVLMAVGIAPVVEEVLFRGILLPLLIRRIGPGPGVALTALAFALLHGDLGALVALALFSVALSLAYARTGSLRVPIVMHMLFNGANVLLLLGLLHAGWV